MAAIYIHIPYCRRRCTYCDFYLTTTRRSIDVFVARVSAEIESTAGFQGLAGPVRSVYFGGGTPSLLAPAHVCGLLSRVSERFQPLSGVETTLEANPEDLDPSWLHDLLDAGINRLSIGVQSLNDAHLQWMGRCHTADIAMRGIGNAVSAGFENISVDLITGLPGSDVQDTVRSIERIIALPVSHVSVYSLTVKRRTVLGKSLARGLVVPVGDEAEVAHMAAAREKLTEAGFRHYEISNFAREGYACVHNLAYWKLQPFRGYGPSAHSFFQLDDRHASRSAVAAHLRHYLDPATPFEVLYTREALGPDELVSELILLGLRTDDGIDLDRIRAVSGRDLLEERAREIDDLLSSGLICLDGHRRILLQPSAYRLCDAVTAKLV